METVALPPPRRLEKLVGWLTPPAAREVVLGDLHETYQSPRQYLADAARTLPFVIASQARRNLNGAVLGLQGFLLFFCLGGGAARALGPVLALLLIQAVLDAWLPVARPAPRRAVPESLAAAFVMLLACHLLVGGMAEPGADSALWLQVSFAAPFVFPLLAVFRIALTGGAGGLARPPSARALRRHYRRFAARTRRIARLEALALLAAAGGLLLHIPDLPESPALAALAALAVVSALYLWRDGGARALPRDCDPVSLRALYRAELLRWRQLRHFLCWLWCLAPLAALYAGLVQAGFAAQRPVLVVLGAMAMTALFYAVNALNREQAGRSGEVARMLERAS